MLCSTSSLAVKPDCLWLPADTIPRRPGSQHKIQMCAESCSARLLWTPSEEGLPRRDGRTQRRPEVLTGPGWLFCATGQDCLGKPTSAVREQLEPNPEKNEGIRGPRSQLCVPVQGNPCPWTSVSPLWLGLGLEFTGPFELSCSESQLLT